MSILSVNTNIDALFAQNILGQVERSMSTSMRRIASGLRINTAADDPTGIAVLTNARAQIGGNQAAQRNVQDAHSMLSTADGTLAQIEDALIEMRALCVRGGNDATLTTAQITELGAQHSSLSTMIDSLAANTKWGLKNVLTGTLMTASRVVQVGPDKGMTVKGKLIHATLTKATFSAIGGAAATAFTKATKATAQLAIVDVAIGKVADARANVGGYMHQMETNLDAQMNAEVNNAATASSVGDADLAAEITNLARNMIISQSATAVLGQANVQAQTLLGLLSG